MTDRDELEPIASDQDGLSRRKLLTGAAAAGGALWVAPTITGVAAASAASPVCTCRGRGTALKFTGAFADALNAVPLPAEYGSSGGPLVCERDLSALNLFLQEAGGSASADLLCGGFDAESCSATARVVGLNGFLPTSGDGIRFVDVTLDSLTTFDCDCNLSRSSSITTGSVNDFPASLPAPPNTTVVFPEFQVILNEQVCEGTEAVTRAMRLTIETDLGSAGIIIGETRVSNDNPDCACVPAPPGPTLPGGIV